MYIWIILMLVGVFLDQISKYLIVLNLDLYESVAIIPKVFNFTYIQNTGAAFGMMGEEGSRWIFMVISTIMIVAILVYIFWKKPTDKLLMSALSMIVAGGIGNMIDRIRLGYVVDFLDFCALPQIWKWTFNVADSFVTVGAMMMVVWLILDMVRESKKAKVEKAHPETLDMTEDIEAQTEVEAPTNVDASIEAEAQTENDAEVPTDTAENNGNE